MKNGGKFSVSRRTGLNLEGFSLNSFPLDDKSLLGDYLNYITNSAVPDWQKKDFHI
jgi:hypothetical protein